MLIGLNWRWLGALALAAVAMPHETWAQSGSKREPAQTFEDLASRSKPGDSVYVTDSEGREVRAKIDGLSPSSLTIWAGGDRRELSESQVAMVRRGSDSLWNGAAIGAATGFATLALLLASVCPCNADFYAGEWIVPVMGYGGIGAGVGVAIDLAIRKGRVIYQKPTGRTASFNVSPVISTKQRAVFASVRF